MAAASFSTPPALPSVPTSAQNLPGWIMRAAQAINGLLTGRASVTMTVTLAPSATSSVIYDSRISLTTAIGLTPQTAHAATAFASGSFYVVPAAGSATIFHPSTADADKTFAATIFG